MRIDAAFFTNLFLGETPMDAYLYTAEELFDEVFNETEDFLLLDVRNEEEFSKFSIEGPFLKETLNLPYFEFIEFEEESVRKVPRGRKLKIVCAKEGSAKYVADILSAAGFDDVSYLAGGIGMWADLLKPVLVEKRENYSIVQFIRPGKASLSYGLICGDELMVFDPARTAELYLDYAENNGLQLTKSFETHLQADYISGSKKLGALQGAEIVANENDFSMAVFHYTHVGDRETIVSRDGKTVVEAIHTPGHTPGSTSYLVDGRFLMSGDAVFIKSIGRPDLGGKVDEWSGLLFETIQKVLKKLGGTINVLPGHYMDWTEFSHGGIVMASLREIMDGNGDIYDLENSDAFTRFIKSNMRKQPDVYAEIRKVNAGLLEPSDDEQKVMDVGKNECAASAS
jgi:glyoxylase-like metal-dependent hydrolase (beta-lactamase superfamily II)